jgi:thiol-disulfide isomerase/thioredoxin
MGFSTARGEDFYNLVKENRAEGYFVFFGASWCGHCRNFKGTFEIMAKKSASKSLEVNPTFVNYDANDNDAVTSYFNIRSYPTLIYIKNGRFVRHSGPRGEEEIVKFFKTEINDENSEEFMKTYPTKIDEAIMFVQKASSDVWNEAMRHWSMYPTSGNAIVVFFLICLGINFYGLFVCLKSCICPTRKQPPIISSNKSAAGNDADLAARASVASRNDRNSDYGSPSPERRESEMPVDRTSQRQTSQVDKRENEETMD